jgi:hypothetical protein
MRISAVLGALVLTVAATSPLAADPIDVYLRSPGATGDPMLAARMFAWCSSRYEYLAWLESQKPDKNPRNMLRQEEQARGARAAGAYHLYRQRTEDIERGITAEESGDRDFVYYLGVVESMAGAYLADIGVEFAFGSPEDNMETLAGLLRESERCIVGTLPLQHELVKLMTPAQIADAKKRGSVGRWPR